MALAGRPASALVAAALAALGPAAFSACSGGDGGTAARAQARSVRGDSAARGEPAAGTAAATPLSESPQPAAAEELERGAEPGRERRSLEDDLLRARSRRDELLARLRSLETSRQPGVTLTSALRRRRARGELEDVVGELHRLQARLLELRARSVVEAEAEAEREWARLESLVAEAAASWREGRSEEPELGPAIAAALERVGEPVPRDDVRRYRELVGRLVRVNGVIARAESGSVAEREPSTIRGGSAAPRSGFLGLMDRGAIPVSDGPGPQETSLETWKRLRAGLAGEIVATASEITRRVRASL